ncbi:MAG TPA: LysR family transcriptional regulator [Polyangiaceae bacterium]|nr:LysR family transcriptional regulator [Polyangiaceae bacterium]
MDPALIPALYDVMMVARVGSVAVAARRLNKTPSAVSQQIRRITDALGVVLFERRGRGLALTQAAEHVFPAATRLFDEAEAVFGLFGELSGSAVTTLRIAASDYLGKPLLVPVLRDLAAEGVPLHFEISTVHSEESLALLERGAVEMAIVSQAGATDRSGLSGSTLLEQDLFWVSPKRAPIKRGARRLPLSERLTKGPVLRLAPGSLGRKLLDRHLEQHAIRPASTVDVPSVSLLLAYATGGVGIGLVPALSLDGHDLGTLLVEPSELARLPVQLVTRSGRPLVPVVERFTARLLQQAERERTRLDQILASRAR